MPEKKQGDERITEQYRSNGEDMPVRDAARNYGPTVDQQGGDMMELTYSAGRTISLGNFEFVRIQIGAKVGRNADVDNDKCDMKFDKVKAFVCEVLDREEALVRKVTREPEALPALSGVNRAVWVEYGLTINAAAKFESHKIDIGLSRPIGDNEDASEAMTALETYLAQRISDERERLRGRE